MASSAATTKASRRQRPKIEIVSSGAACDDPDDAPVRSPPPAAAAAAAAVALPMVHPTHQYQRQLLDLPPKLLCPPVASSIRGHHASKNEKNIAIIDQEHLQRHDSVTETTSFAGCCQVCQTHQARYTCPKCSLPYCSLDCYRNHNNNASSGAESAGMNSCTELFYQSRVNAILKLEQKEYAQQVQRTIRRLYQKQQESYGDEYYKNKKFLEEEEEDSYGDSKDQHADDVNEDENDSEDDDDDKEFLSKAELIQLANILNERETAKGNKNVEWEDDLEQVLQSPRIQAALRKAVQNGELDPCIVPWRPWWTPEYSKTHLHHNMNDHGSSDDNSHFKNNDLTITPYQAASLDEQILQIPLFSALTKSAPSPLLVYNLIDILYAFVRTLRLYNGLMDDAVLLVAEEAATVLIDSSSVLSQDARYTCIPHVLTECTISSMTAFRNGHSTCNTPWTILVEDVATILSNRRLVSRALLEALDLIQTAISAAAAAANDKKGNQKLQHGKQRRHDSSKNGTSSSASSVTSTSLSRLRKSPFKVCMKKLEYYLSWSRHVLFNEPDTATKNLVTEIRAWACDWNNHNNHADVQDNVIVLDNHPL